MDPTGNSWRRLSSVRLSRQILWSRNTGVQVSLSETTGSNFVAALTAFEATLGRFNWQEARRRLTLSFLNEIITGRLRGRERNRERGGGAFDRALSRFRNVSRARRRWTGNGNAPLSRHGSIRSPQTSRVVASSSMAGDT